MDDTSTELLAEILKTEQRFAALMAQKVQYLY